MKMRYKHIGGVKVNAQFSSKYKFQYRYPHQAK